MGKLSQLACSTFAVMMLAPAACTAISPDGKDATDTLPPDDHTSATMQAITGTQRICSGVSPGNWRDTLVVNDGWLNATCRSWAQSIGAPTWQLGCLFDTSFSWGITGGGLPGANCGWAPIPASCPNGTCPNGSCAPPSGNCGSGPPQ